MDYILKEKLLARSGGKSKRINELEFQVLCAIQNYLAGSKDAVDIAAKRYMFGDADLSEYAKLPAVDGMLAAIADKNAGKFGTPREVA